MLNLNLLQTQFQIGAFEFSLVPDYSSLDLIKALSDATKLLQKYITVLISSFWLRATLCPTIVLTALFTLFKDSTSWRSIFSPALLFPVPLCEETFDLWFELFSERVQIWGAVTAS